MHFRNKISSSCQIFTNEPASREHDFCLLGIMWNCCYVVLTNRKDILQFSNSKILSFQIPKYAINLDSWTLKSRFARKWNLKTDLEAVLYVKKKIWWSVMVEKDVNPYSWQRIVLMSMCKMSIYQFIHAHSHALILINGSTSCIL